MRRKLVDPDVEHEFNRNIVELRGEHRDGDRSTRNNCDGNIGSEFVDNFGRHASGNGHPGW